MNEEKNPPQNRSWLERLSQALTGEPRDRGELVEILRDATEREVLDANSLGMIEGVLGVPQKQVRDIMLPSSQMIVINKAMSLDEIIPLVVKTAHSRFPVIADNKDEVVGLLLAKDLLAYSFNGNREHFKLEDIMRPAVFVPESKRLDVLLQEFRLKRNHMAIVVDEYGCITGLVTIEDVLEQIVGNIEDEYDTQSDQLITKINDSQYTIKAITPLEEFNDTFNTEFDEPDVETVGGLITRSFGHVPKRGETISLEQGFHFKILRADDRRIHLLQLTIPKNEASQENH